MDELLWFFEHNLHLGLKDKHLVEKYNKKLKQRLFEIFDDEVAKFFESANLVYEKTRDPKIFGDLENAIENSIQFRRNVSVKAETDKLADIRRKLSVKTSESVDLIANYLGAVADSKHHMATKTEDYFGEVVFEAGILNNSDLFVHLKSVGDLKPRPNREDVNFRLNVSVLPLKNDDKSFKMSQKTLAYPQKKYHLVN